MHVPLCPLNIMWWRILRISFTFLCSFWDKFPPSPTWNILRSWLPRYWQCNGMLADHLLQSLHAYLLLFAVLTEAGETQNKMLTQHFLSFMLYRNPIFAAFGTSSIYKYSSHVLFRFVKFIPFFLQDVKLPDIQQQRLREALISKKCSFFEHCSKGLWPPPLLFEHLSYFAGGVF